MDNKLDMEPPTESTMSADLSPDCSPRGCGLGDSYERVERMLQSVATLAAQFQSSQRHRTASMDSTIKGSEARSRLLTSNSIEASETRRMVKIDSFELLEKMEAIMQRYTPDEHTAGEAELLDGADCRRYTLMRRATVDGDLASLHNSFQYEEIDADAEPMVRRRSLRLGMAAVPNTMESSINGRFVFAQATELRMAQEQLVQQSDEIQSLHTRLDKQSVVQATHQAEVLRLRSLLALQDAELKSLRPQLSQKKGDVASPGADGRSSSEQSPTQVPSHLAVAGVDQLAARSAWRALRMSGVSLADAEATMELRKGSLDISNGVQSVGLRTPNSDLLDVGCLAWSDMSPTDGATQRIGSPLVSRLLELSPFASPYNGPYNGQSGATSPLARPGTPRTPRTPRTTFVACNEGVGSASPFVCPLFPIRTLSTPIPGSARSAQSAFTAGSSGATHSCQVAHSGAASGAISTCGGTFAWNWANSLQMSASPQSTTQPQLLSPCLLR